MSVTLIAYPLNDSDVEVPYILDTMGEIDVAMTYTITDIQDITKRRGSFSKTVVLPSTATNDQCFGFAYNIQSFVGGFTPNKKIRAALWDDGVQIFSGVLQLMSMSKTRGEVTYEIGLFGEDVSLFQATEAILLAQTAGVSGMNHTPTAALVSSTWGAALGSGYVYGMVDSAGYSDVRSSARLTLGYYELSPSIYIKQMIDLIFTQAGYRYQSSFFNSDAFKRLVMPYAAGTLAVNLSGSTVYAQATGSVTGSQTVTVKVNFSNDNVSPFFDNGGYWVASASTLVPPTIRTRWNCFAQIRISTATLSVEGTAGGDFQIYDTIASSVVASQFAELTSSTYPITVGLQFENITVSGNTNLILRYDEQVGSTFVQIASGSTITWVALENPASVGNINMNTALPGDIRQSDLIVDLQKMFNLHFMPDPDDPKLIYIEPWTTFYSSGSVDWSMKADENAEKKITNGDPNAYRRIIMKYKDAGDYLSRLYKASYPLAIEGYGGRIFDTNNYYGRGDNVIELKAATVIPGAFTSEKVIGRTFEIDGSPSSGTIKALQNNYRIAQFTNITGSTTVAPYPWNFITAAASSMVVSSLPYIGHINNPYNPTNDLAFGIPRQVYYDARNASGSTIAYTNNNLYNQFWWNFILETTSKEALQLEQSMMLTTTDIATLDFRKPIFYGGVLWRLLEIRDYLVGQKKPCRVTLRRILNLTDFVPRSVTSAPYNGPEPPYDPNSNYPNEPGTEPDNPES